ncbi:F-box/kelch-repeat protein [Glycine soja]
MRSEMKPQKHAIKEESWSPLLCDELIEEILSRLPVKPLIQFKCVCKGWNSLMSDPYFIKLHLSKSAAKDDLEHLQLMKNVCLGSIPEIHMESCDVSSLFHSLQIETFLFNLANMSGYHLVGSCNGLHCGVSEIPEGYRVCFWNKATRVISRESPTLSFSPGIGRRTMFGFGYDPSSDKYKVVAIALTMLSLDVSEKTEMKVYGAGDSSWRNLKGFPVLWTLPKVGGVYLSGTLNWVVIKGKETIHSEIVIIFVDLEKKTCRSLFLPDDFWFFDTNIGVFRDSLCVWQDSNTHLGLWQMRKFGDDKSWIQLINFSYLHLNIRPYEEKSMILPLCMSNNGDFFMLKFTRNADDEYQTILYNKRDGKSQVSVVPSGSFRTLLWRNLKIFTKTESLRCNVILLVECNLEFLRDLVQPSLSNSIQARLIPLVQLNSGSSINTAEFSASRTSLDGSAHMIQVRQTTIQLGYAQAKQALQVQPNFTQHGIRKFRCCEESLPLVQRFGKDDIDCPYARSFISLQGIEEKTAKLKGSEKALVARHEASHAVVGTAVANLLAGQPHVEKSCSPLLCDELIKEILSRLPVKTLIQFKCVYKGWNSLMSDPYFIKLHLNKSAAKDDLEHLQLMKNVCLGSIPEIHMESCDVSSLFHSLQIETFLFNFANMPGNHLVGSCNGLHCGVSEIPEGYRNKETRVISRELPTLSFSPGIGRRTMLGFGYDPSSDKYKVVAIALTMLSLDVSQKTEMKVYSAGDSSWRNLKGFPVLWTLPKVGGVYLSGTLNCVVIKGKETIHSEIIIISVDLEKETCRSLFLPNDFCFVDTNIGVFRDSLYLHLNIRPYEEKSMILPLCMSNNGDFFMLKFTRNANDEYQTILYNQGDGKSQVSVIPSDSFRTLLWRNLKIFTKISSTEFGSVISAEGSSANTAEFSASRTFLDGSANMIQVRPTPIQLCYAQASEALQVQPNFTQHVPYSHSWPNQVHPPLPINCLLESLFGGLESENTCSRKPPFGGEIWQKYEVARIQLSNVEYWRLGSCRVAKLWLDNRNGDTVFGLWLTSIAGYSQILVIRMPWWLKWDIGAVKTDLNGKVITNDDDKEIPDAVNTLIFTIAQHFIGDPSLWKDRSAELLSNLKCKTLVDFRWYRDTFLTWVYTREDSQQPFWKEKFLTGLPRSLGDKVRDKIRSQSANGDIPYESLSYAQLISYVQKVALKICQDDKIQRQLAKEKAQTKKDLGSFCEQFGLPACPKQKKKQSSRKEIHENKPVNTKISKEEILTQTINQLKKKLRNLNLEPAIEEQINNLLIETSEEEIETSSSVLSDENLNLIQQDDQLSSTDDDDGQINTLTREQDLLFEAINSIPDPQEKKVFLEKLKKTLKNTSRAPQTHYLTTLPVNSYRKVVMPTKASGIFLRGGRSTGKGARLALPEPTIKKSSTSSGSPTQVGSSTQKTNLEGSSTQIASIKPEPSTQESPKPVTAKQTSADYAWPIETLQALQDMCLTKIPKIIKKSWADIASKSDDESESNLQTMIQNASMTKTTTNTKGKLPLAKTQTPPTKQTNNYIYKNKLLIVLQMEPEFWDKNPFKATAKAFPPGFHYKPTTILKTRTFYELILVDSNSVSIKHFKDPKDQTLNTHSTIQILKVLQPRHFGSDLNKGKRFSVPFDLVGYTYWDYVDAWTKVFWHQNTRFKHSWLIYFKTNTIYNFPNWFLQWWDFFGPIPEIFPETESRIPADLKYFSSFALSWIFSWQHTFVKWWTQFDSFKADPEQVKLWFQSHPEFLKAADPETSVFLNQMSHLAAFLAGSTSKEVLAKNLMEVLQMLQQEEEASSSKKEETSYAEKEEEDPFYQNEDDCFGICLD